MKEFALTDTVTKTGEYVCTVCGEMTEFEEGDDFAACESCEDQSGAWTPAVEDFDEEENAEEEEQGL